MGMQVYYIHTGIGCVLMNKAFITGATGFLGVHLAEELLKNGISVYALCRENSENISRLKELNGIHIIYGNLESIDMLPELIDERDFDVFYHLAWKGASGELRQHGDVQINNILWTYKAAETALKLNCKKLVVSGTICENQSDLLVQQEKFGSSSFYLAAKRSAYDITRSFCKQNNLPLVWCTFYHPVGKYNKKEQFITNTILKMLDCEALNFGPADSLFDVVAVEDLCHGFYLAGKCNLKNDRYYIGSGKPRVLRDYLENLRELICPDAIMNYGYYKPDNLKMDINWLDISPFQKETGYAAKYSFEEIILGTKKWLEDSIKDSKK